MTEKKIRSKNLGRKKSRSKKKVCQKDSVENQNFGNFKIFVFKKIFFDFSKKSWKTIRIFFDQKIFVDKKLIFFDNF